MAKKWNEPVQERERKTDVTKTTQSKNSSAHAIVESLKEIWTAKDKEEARFLLKNGISGLLIAV